MNNQHTYYEDLKGLMSKTKGARFTAAASLKNKERASMLVISFLSIYLLALSVGALAFPSYFQGEASQFFGSLSVVASASLLVLSLFDYAYGRSVQAEKLHQNALEITVILRELERELVLPAPNYVRASELGKRYEEKIIETQVNHTTLDYKRYLLSRKSETSLSGKSYIFLATVFRNLQEYGISMMAHILVTGMILGSTIWYMFLK